MPRLGPHFRVGARYLAKIIKARRHYRPNAKFTTYLFTLARNRMIDHYRAQAGRVPTTRADGQPVEVEDVPGAARDRPDMRAHIRDVLDRSLERIHSLPPEQRETVLMYADGLGMVEIAEITQVPVDTARSRVRHALAKLRKELQGLVS